MSCAHAVRRVGAAFTSTARITPVESPAAALPRGRSKLMRQYPGRGRQSSRVLAQRYRRGAGTPLEYHDVVSTRCGPPVVSDPRAASVAALTASDADPARSSYLPKHTLTTLTGRYAEGALCVVNANPSGIWLGRFSISIDR